MGYAQALEKAWSDLAGLTADNNFSIKFLSDTYYIDLAKRQALSDSCNIPSKEHISIITLHYLIRKLKATTGMPQPVSDWIDFNHLEGGEVYFTAFKNRTIDHIIKKFGSTPELLLKSAERFPSKVGSVGDTSVIIYPFDEVPILITMWKGDDEFGPDANILYDRSISGIFCMEDIVVLTEIVVHQL